MKTTLNKIREHDPCSYGWKKLLTYLNKTKADDEPLSLLTILNSNGLEDALWCLRAISGYDKEIRLYAVWCARQVQHLMKDERSINALDVAERFANGNASVKELGAASAASSDAVWDASSDADWDAATDASSDAASAAAWAAASATASATASAAASAADWDAAWAAARDAARAAARAASRAAASAADWDAARDAQEKELRRILENEMEKN
jgi:hypothetical protein